jgi:hypothetical protein
MPTKPVRLSKTRVLQGLQCPKAAYLHLHRPDLIPPTSTGQQAIFDQGHEVGAAAREVFPGGKLIDVGYVEVDRALAETKAAIDGGETTIFEGTFVAEDVLVKVDIMRRSSANDDWHLIEVKSTTRVKDQHIDDVAIQAHVLAKAGIQVGEVAVMHLNRDHVAGGAEPLFKQVAVGTEVESRLSTLSEEVERLKAVLAGGLEPDRALGPHCDAPYTCAFKSHCWRDIPSPSIFEIPRFEKSVWTAFEAGIVRLDDERLGPFERTRAKQVEAARTGTRWVDKKTIAKRLSSWTWPLHFMDFETIGLALPRYPGTRPYQQIPFQFSLHFLNEVSADPEHREFLYDGSNDPRPAFLDALLINVGAEGSVVCYNGKFEADRLRELSKHFVEHASALANLMSRIVDPLPIFREAVYDRAFRGRFGLKVVAPAILGSGAGYDSLGVQDGGEAQAAFRVLSEGHAKSTEHQSLRQALLSYCRQDTSVMVDLVRWLFQQTKNAPGPGTDD